MTESPELEKKSTNESAVILQKIKTWPHETKIAAFEWTLLVFLPVLFSTLTFIFSLPSLVQPATPIPDELILKGLFSSGEFILFFILFGLILPAVLYLIFKSKFNEKLSVFFYGSLFFLYSELLFSALRNFVAFDRFIEIQSDFKVFYLILCVLFYFALIRFIFLVHEQTKRKSKGENNSFQLIISFLILILILCTGILFYHLDDSVFTAYFGEVFFIILSILLSLYMFYKFLFRKEVTPRSLGYLPLSILITFFMSFVTAIIFLELNNRFFNFDAGGLVEFLGGIVAGFVYILTVWILAKMYSLLKGKISKNKTIE
ncbi:hypothetical protein [Methanolapillus ohkumae]|uniref:Uncharacterized protein n=1 Tax=Methanolapillus ohkumae TaxID=3028298 RepID=A0AA96V6E4_9EURY|nr:hypothetical protein MsAm2_01150 [Methanosarcinaceae archaeon Am2]